MLISYLPANSGSEAAWQPTEFQAAPLKPLETYVCEIKPAWCSALFYSQPDFF